MPLLGPVGDYIQLIWELAAGINLIKHLHPEVGALITTSCCAWLTFLKDQLVKAPTARGGSRPRALLHIEFQVRGLWTDIWGGLCFSGFLLDR